MKIIRRYDLAIEPYQAIDIPYNAEIIRFGTFNDKPALWAIVDPTESSVTRRFTILADEKPLPQFSNRTKFVGSFEHKAEVGSHVLHVLEE